MPREQNRDWLSEGHNADQLVDASSVHFDGSTQLHSRTGLVHSVQPYRSNLVSGCLDGERRSHHSGWVTGSSRLTRRREAQHCRTHRNHITHSLCHEMKQPAAHPSSSFPSYSDQRTNSTRINSVHHWTMTENKDKYVARGGWILVMAWIAARRDWRRTERDELQKGMQIKIMHIMKKLLRINHKINLPSTRRRPLW